MNVQRQTNTFGKGMNMDLDYSVIDSQQYNYAENVRIIANKDSSTGIMQNIEGVIKTTPTMQIANETIIHVTTIRDWAIVFTVTAENTNNIYRYDFSNSQDTPVVTKVLNSIVLGIEPIDGVYAVSSVGRWENEDNVKIYWCDGIHQIRVLNVDDAHDNSNITADSLNVLPEGILPPVAFQSFGTGSLKAGKYQYCYQLFNPRSTETALSVISPMFTVLKDSSKTNSINVTGDEFEENTGKSISFGTSLLMNNFSRAKIIQLYYKNNVTIPTITIIDDIAISGNTLSYEDKGGGVINELTVDEFNALSGYDFIPRVIESKDNRLFAANITENTWDVPNSLYDTRAYRCNSNGEVKLLSNSGSAKTFTINSIPTDIAEDHDCICPYNVDDTNKYVYTINDDFSYVYGGKGLNIYYDFVTADLIEDDENMPVSGLLPDNWSLGSDSYNFNKLPLYTRVANDSTKTVIDNVVFSSSSKKIPNYSNPEIVSKMTGYHRDEIYRFGVVFYNKYNQASPVHWIADIKMPKTTDSGFNSFDTNVQVNINGTTTDNKVLVTHPLGVRFILNNLNVLVEQGVKGIEIVRCERTILDRSILMQGLVSQVINHTDEPSTLIPFPYAAYSNKHGLFSMTDDYRYSWRYSKHVSGENFLFISPEICINRENVSELLEKASNLEGLLNLRSRFEPDTNMGLGDSNTFKKISYDNSNNRVKLLSGAKALKSISDSNIYTNLSKWEENDGWVYSVINVSSFDDGDATGNIYNMLRIDSGNSSNDSNYNAVLAKYYLPFSNTDNTITTVNKAVYAPLCEPFDVENNSWRSKGIAIGDKTYYNWCWDTAITASNEGAGEDTTHNNNVRKSGPHGPCAILQVENALPAIDSETQLNDTISVKLCNLKQNVNPYGGAGYSARQNSIYISTGNYFGLSNATSVAKSCFGGDTYIGVMDYAKCMMSFKKDDYTPDNEFNKLYSGIYFPCESSINLSLRGDEFQVSKTVTSNGYANHFIQNDVTKIGNLYTQSKPLYAYNDAYSAQPRSKVFVSKSIYDIDNLHTDTRVINSEVKTNNEISDSWTKFKVANYIDVDTRFGSINNMKLFQNQLLFWQTDAFGTLSVNDRSLITDNNIGALTLGTGDVLARYDYISLKNGSKENQLRTATASDSTMYWYDYDRNEICSFGNGLNYVSKLKGVQSYLNDNKSSFTLDPKTVYDKKYNETLFTLEDKTLVYNEQMGAFSSFYTFSPDWWIEFSDKLYVFNSLNCFKYNAGDDTDLFAGEDKIAYMRFIVNDGYPQTKTFDNVEYSGDFTRGTNFNEIYFDTKRQRSYSLTDKEIDYREDTYKFCIPRNSLELSEIGKLVNKSYKDRMKGKYLVCHYKYNCNGGNTFEVPYISTAYRPSMI